MKDFESADKDLQAKTEKWEKALEDIKSVVDGLGLGLDPSVRELVVAINLNGIITDGSCGGHTRGVHIRGPFLMGTAENMPKFRRVGEKEIVEELMSRYKISRMGNIFLNKKAEREYYDKTRGLKETKEYKDWYNKNIPLIRDVQNILDEFNQQNDDKKFPLYLSPIYPGYRIEVKTGNFPKLTSNSNEAKRKKAKHIVLESQKVFEKFRDFLKTRYFNR